jgi:hypothetical protein
MIETVANFSLMTPQELIGKVLEIMRNIQFSPPHQDALAHRFFAGRPSTPYGIPIEWWVTSDGNAAAEDLAHSARVSESALATAHEPRLAEQVFEVFGVLIVDQRLFALSRILAGTARTLFDAISTADKPAVAQVVYDRWLADCRAEVVNWLVVSPLQNTESESVKFPGGISLIVPSDATVWSNLEKRFSAINRFDLERAVSDNRLSVFENGVSAYPYTWIAAEECSSADLARQNVAARAKTFVAIAISFASETSPSLLLRMGWKPTNRSFQFSESDGWVLGSIGQLMPPTGGKLIFSADLNAKIKNWYHCLDAADVAKQEKIIKASQALHDAMLQGTDTEQFLHYFFVIDALFGNPRLSRASIERGVARLTNNKSTWSTRIALLYRLRSVIAHGALNDIARWQDLRSYRSRFRANPLGDIRALALWAMRDSSS